jgi:hypothetical protein
MFAEKLCVWTFQYLGNKTVYEKITNNNDEPGKYGIDIN